MNPVLIAQALKSKTVWFGLILSILSWLQASWADAGLTPEQLGVTGSVVGTLIIILRAVTTQPLSEK